MATSHDLSSTVPVNLERELICFICTETVYQPLTLIDCLHSFCGSCLKEWFSHQHRKASSSHSSSNVANPYTCPTCRATVKDARPDARVNTLLDLFLTVNPSKVRPLDEQQELAKTYKPGDAILPKVEGRRRERRSRRDEDGVEARERRMIEEARERSLLEVHATQPLVPPRPTQPSRSREREERRERRREQERHERRRAHAAESERVQERSDDVEQQRRESASAPVPVTSPRHPEAVEARQRQQTVVHQASLVSLISSSDGGTGSSSGSDNLSEIMQEIQALGLLDGIDVDAMSEAEQDALAERIAEAYRQSRRERNQRNNPSSGDTVSRDDGSPSPPRPSPNTLQVDDGRRRRRTPSGSRQRRAETMPSPARDDPVNERVRTVRTQPLDSTNSLPPPSNVVIHRRRRSSQGQHSDNSRNTSRRSSPTRSSHSRSQSINGNISGPHLHDQSVHGRISQSNVNQRPPEPERTSSRSSNLPVHAGSDTTHPQNTNLSSNESVSRVTVQSNISPAQHPADLSNTLLRPSRAAQPVSQTTAHTRRRTSGIFDEPSISCFRCHRADIQYEVYKRCDKCEVDLCKHCYRTGRGCKHWYGFGHAALAQFEISHPAPYEQVELPHVLRLGCRYTRPQQSTIIKSKLAKDGSTIIPLQTTSEPGSRFQEGQFCDRCGAYANSCFWSCDYCNYGEWGFCRDCVNTHHCCTHPLLPSAHRSLAPSTLTARPNLDEMINPTASELYSATLKPSPNPSQPSSAASASSAIVGPLPDFIDLVITTHCDICSQPIPPSEYRFHCPFHPSPSSTDPDAHGDYDICTPCYHNLVKTNRIKRDDGPAGWRKCPSGHRMIITTFHADNDGGQRRVVMNDLVGGWKTPEEAMADWNAEVEASRDQANGGDGTSSPDSATARRFARTRTSSWSADPSSPTLGSPFSSSSRFPPDGGSGLRGVAWYSYFPEDVERGPNDLVFPIGAEIREVRINEEYPDWYGGVYAGDRGLLPTSYLRIVS